ncbi:uncharacterized protein LOC105901660 isoform X2 [Clupea harengus]|uniref:Uncharacterized protein LOC105901660 isoform X2 n=1 Tax=Clupea harengus TaxID=7950 RepID=A0A6P8GCQ3_CLUHA|nr:uncharacterized protein LOC105901660 isoform X2 [Clupea harengus]
MRILLCVLLGLLFAVSGEGKRGEPKTSTGSCVPITIPLCQDLPYNHTLMPNIYGHASQEDAGLEVHQFWPLVNIQCSRELKPFLCSLYAPECESGRTRAPCKRTCQAARQGCEPLKRKFGFEWPENFDCERFSEETCEAVSVTATGEGKRGEPKTSTGSCVPITIPLCQDLPYNHTLMPNIYGHASQREAGVEMDQFSPLVKVKCSPAFKPFICSVYAPECESRRTRAPCKRTCQEARQGCEPLMTKFGFDWPKKFDCEQFSEETCEEVSVTATNIKKSDLSSFLKREGVADLSPTTCLRLFFHIDRDGSGDLNGEEYQALKSYLSVLKQQFTRWLLGPREYSMFDRILKEHGVSLSQKTTEAIWTTYSFGKESKYDDFVAMVAGLITMKGRFDAKLLSGLPCDCKIAAFTFDELIYNTAL